MCKWVRVGNDHDTRYGLCQIEYLRFLDDFGNARSLSWVRNTYEVGLWWCLCHMVAGLDFLGFGR